MRLLDLVRVDVQKRQKMKQILFSLLAYFILARGRVLLDTMDEGLMNYEEDDSFAQLQVGISFFSKYVHVSSLKSTRTLCKCAWHSIKSQWDPRNLQQSEAQQINVCHFLFCCENSSVNYDRYTIIRQTTLWGRIPTY